MFKRLIFIATDIIFAALAVWSAFLLRFDGSIPEQYLSVMYTMAGLVIIFMVPVFYFKKLYSFTWAYVSTSELISLFGATTIVFILLGLAIFFLHDILHFAAFPRSTIFISYFLVFILCGALRISKRIYLRLVGQGRMTGREKTLIVGAGDAGEQILRSIISSGSSPYFPVGFVDDNPSKRGVVIHGSRVLGNLNDIPKIVENYQIKQLVIALPTAGSKKIKEAVDLGKKAGIWKIKIVPPLSEIMKSKLSFKNLKNVEVEDLLGREEVTLDKKQIESFIKNKTILITGAAGSIGSELSRQVAKFGPKSLLLLDQDETGIFNIEKELKSDFSGFKIEPIIADITDKKRIGEIFQNFNPEIVFHAAAYKHVFLMEQNPAEAVKNNIFGTRVLAETSVESKVEKFILISSDKAVNPGSVMGASKRVCEMVCRSLNKKDGTRFISVRFGNVLNSRGSVIPIFREQIRKGGPVEVTHPDMKRYFMLTSEACLLVLQSGAMGQGGEVFVLDMGKPIKIVDLAKEMIKLSGLQLDKDIAVVFIGPRPGEKMFEEILTAEEGTVATQNQRIFIARVADKSAGGLENKLEALERAAVNSTKEDIIKVLFDIIPTSSHKS